MLISYHYSTENDRTKVINLGRAKDNKLWNICTYPEPYLYRLHIIDRTIMCLILIGANGNVLPGGAMMDFTTQDQLSPGNIMTEPFHRIIARFQDRCLLLCKELYHIDIDNYAFRNHHLSLTPNKRILHGIRSQINKRILHVRELAQESYPHIPSPTIIERFPMVIDDACSEKFFDKLFASNPLLTEVSMDFVIGNCDDYTLDLYDCYKRTNPEASLSNMDTILLKMVALLNSKQPLQPYYLLGNDAQIKQSPLFLSLGQIEQDCK